MDIIINMFIGSSFACHLPYDAAGAPYAMKVKLCNDCNKATVGEILLANVEPHNVWN